MVELRLGLLLLSFVSKHKMWSYYDLVYCCWHLTNPNHNTTIHILCLLTDDNPIIIRPHVVFTDGWQQRQPNHNSTIYYVYWQRNQQLTRKHYMWWLWLGLSLWSVSRHKLWYYDWVYCCFRSSENIIHGGVTIGFIVVVVRQ
jgi:hypothetical protein